MYKRAVMTAVATLCAAGMITIGTVASASGSEGNKVNFIVHSQVPPSQFAAAFPADFSRCTFTATTPPNVASPCVAPVTPTLPPGVPPGAYDDQVTGDFVGTGDFVKSAVLATLNSIDPTTLDLPSTDYEPYSLTVAGCGSGTVIVRTEGNVGVVAGSTTGEWKLVPNSGRGGLAGISGSGTYTVSHNPDGTVSNIATGHVRCGTKD
jgi:hypothetical protein